MSWNLSLYGFAEQLLVHFVIENTELDGTVREILFDLITDRSDLFFLCRGHVVVCRLQIVQSHVLSSLAAFFFLLP
jgi:hypothetical protein